MRIPRVSLFIAAISAVAFTVLLMSQAIVAADDPRIGLKRTHPAWSGETADSFVYAPLPMPGGSLLVPSKDTLYLIDSKKKVLWSWACVAPLSTRPIIIDKSIYGACFDLIRYKLNALTGKPIWVHESNGRATFGAYQRYKDRFYLEVTLMAEYDDPNDILTLYDSRQDKLVWRKAIPRGATVYVWGDRILVGAHSLDGIEIREVYP